MINVELIGHDNKYYIDEIIDLFIDNREKFNFKILSTLEITDYINVNTQIFDSGVLVSENSIKKEHAKDLNDLEIRKVSKRLLKMSLFKAMKKIIDKEIHWGILTGIRPTKVVHDMVDDEMGEKEILKKLTEEYEIEDAKANLLLEVAKREKSILDNDNKKSISLYIGIPFCPTRCLYCSFTSNSIEKYEYLMEPYLEALFKEIQSAKDIIKSNKWEVQSIYIGGGTPTSLNANQLDRLLDILNNKFDFNTIQEITLEAGRPDTITIEKLKIIIKYGVHRISINPQTMNDETLELIGRKHTSNDIINRFNLARKVGFDNINMDIILGLPKETEEHIIKTMKELQKLNPESVTIHTLSIKRASKLKEEINQHNLTNSEIINNMINITNNYMEKMNLYPYYMYRQKDILGNYENVGYCKENYECIYNIQIIEEKQTILALGAGSVSKIVYPAEDRIERIFNVKSVEHYINRIDEMIERKNILYK